MSTDSRFDLTKFVCMPVNKVQVGDYIEFSGSTPGVVDYIGQESSHHILIALKRGDWSTTHKMDSGQKVWVQVPEDEVEPDAKDPKDEADSESSSSQSRTERLYSTDDALIWAEEWCEVAKELIESSRTIPKPFALDKLIDVGWMIGWFANAMATAAQKERRRIAESIVGYPIKIDTSRFED